MRNQLLSALQELIRTGLLAAIPVIVDGLSSGVIDWQLAGVAAAIAILRALDSLLHSLNVVTPLDVGVLDQFKEPEG